MSASGKNRAGCKGVFIALLATLLIGLPAVADDTELYFNPAPPDAPAPLVMLTLDWRPNTSSTVCSDKSSAACIATFGTDEIGTKIYNALQVTGSAPVDMFESLRAVLKVIVGSDIANGMRIGFMMSHNNDCAGSPPYSNCSNGGYVLRGFETFDATDSNGAKDELIKILTDIPPATAPGHSYQGLELFFELYRYLAGLDVLNGKLGFTDFDGSTGTGSKPPKRNLDHEFSFGYGSPATVCDFGASPTGSNRRCLDYISTSGYSATSPLPTHLTNGGLRIPSTLTWDPTIIHQAGTPLRPRYISPYNNGEDWSCSGAYTINFLFGVSNQDADNNAAITQTLANQGLREWDLTSPPSLTFDNLISKLHQQDHANNQVPGVAPNVAGNQTLTSYFLTPETGPTTGQVRPYAAAGGTGNPIPALSDPRKLFDALSNIFNQINAVSSSYVAVTVPVNADNRVTSLPNLFVALFQVDENGKPYWPGNVKKLKILQTPLPDGSTQLDVNDANGVAAFNPITGRLNDSALTLWTVPTAADVVAADTTKGEVTGRDGSSVRRGGAGHKIPGYISGSVGTKNSDTGARQMFLEPATVIGTAVAGNAMVELDASDTSSLRTDAGIQDLLGIHDTSGTGTCPGRDGDNYCVTFIDEVLTTAGQGTTGTGTDKAPVATQLFLRWIRGFDVFNERGAGGSFNGLTTTAQRKWLMGDVLHSRPLAVNYGIRTGYSKDNQDVRLIFGSNDGMLRMVRNTAAGTTDPSAATQRGAAYGAEVWAFMPRELLAHVPELAMNFGNVGLNRPYGADGQPTLFTIDTNGDGIIENDGSCTVGADDCDRAWVYFGLRRGGKSYYAVDISHPDATTPNLLWKINETTPGFTELGLTFSSPRVGWVQFEDVSATLNLFDLGEGLVNVPVPVVIFGGGYNGHAVTAGDHHHSSIGGPSKDTILDTPFTGADTNEGNAIFIVHARTGELIWKATLGSGAATANNFQAPEMKHGIAAPVSPMDSDGDGILDRLYVADTGGRVWRVDLPEYAPGASPAISRAANWKATLLADLRPSDAALATSTDDDLRFFHGATIIRRARDADGLYDAIAVGSGDREHPQSETNKNNWFFLFKDRQTASGDPVVATRAALVPSDLLNITDICLNEGVAAGDPDPCTVGLGNGWRLALEETGEKNLSEPFAGGNGIIFTTYLPQGIGPDDAKCVPLGASRLYQVSLESGAPLPFLHGVKDSYGKGDRWINLYSGIDGGVVAVSPDFWITSSGKSGSNPPQKPVGFYWRESGVDTVK